MKTAKEVFGEELDESKIKGAFKKFLFRDIYDEGGYDYTISVKQGNDEFWSILSAFESWMDDNVDGFREYEKDNGGRDRVKDILESYVNNNEEVYDRCYDRVVEWVGAGGGSADGNGSEAGDGDGDGGSEGNPFGKVAEVGIINENFTINYSKLKGTMAVFAKDVDEVIGAEEGPNMDEARQAYNRYMFNKFGKDWVNFTMRKLDPETMKKYWGWMWDHHDDLRQNVEDKWVYDPDQLEGNGHDEDGEDPKPHNINDWASKFGTTDEDSGVTDTVKDHKKRKRRDVVSTVNQHSEIKRNHIYHGNVYEVLEDLPKNSVDVVITSPPYYDLREYHGLDKSRIGGDPTCDHSVNVRNECTNCGAWFGFLGNEPEPDIYIENMLSLGKRIKKVLKPTGSFWLNIGDTYAKEDRNSRRNDIKVPRKSQMMVPERVAMKLIDDGWKKRHTICWAKQVLFEDHTVKGNANPSSFKDRFSETHEPFFFFSQNDKYYFDLDSVRREHQTEAKDTSSSSGNRSKFKKDEVDDEMIGGAGARSGREGYETSTHHEKGANLPSVWQVNPGKSSEIHTAVFSERLVEIPIEVGCPKQVCDACGKPYEDGERNCRCPTEETKPGVVLDPFAGRGTTLKKALDMGRDYIGIEASDEYIEIARNYVPAGRQQKLI